MNYHLYDKLKSESSSISGVYTAEKAHQAKPQALNYLDGDSNLKKEAFNQSNM